MGLLKLRLYLEPVLLRQKRRMERTWKIEFGNDLELIVTTRLTQIFNWIEKRFPASSRFYEVASKGFDDSRMFIMNKSAVGDCHRWEGDKEAAGFAGVVTIDCFCIPTLLKNYKWLIFLINIEEKWRWRRVWGLWRKKCWKTQTISNFFSWRPQQWGNWVLWWKPLLRQIQTISNFFSWRTQKWGNRDLWWKPFLFIIRTIMPE